MADFLSVINKGCVGKCHHYCHQILRDLLSHLNHTSWFAKSFHVLLHLNGIPTCEVGAENRFLLYRWGIRTERLPDSSKKTQLVSCRGELHNQISAPSPMLYSLFQVPSGDTAGSSGGKRSRWRKALNSSGFSVGPPKSPIIFWLALLSLLVSLSRALPVHIPLLFFAAQHHVYCYFYPVLETIKWGRNVNWYYYSKLCPSNIAIQR